MPIAQNPFTQPSHWHTRPTDCQGFVLHALLPPLLPLTGFKHSDCRCEYLHCEHSPANKLQKARSASKNGDLQTWSSDVLLGDLLTAIGIAF